MTCVVPTAMLVSVGTRRKQVHKMPREPLRNIRIAPDLWDRALAVAHRRGETLSQVIRAALVRYVKRHEKDEP
jgi:hypothetical protein